MSKPGEINLGLEPIGTFNQMNLRAPQATQNWLVDPSDRICGLRRTAFWLSFALVLVVIAASIAGGLAGGLHKAE